MTASRNRSAYFEWLIISLLLLLLMLLMVKSDWLWRWDRLLYDTQQTLWSKPPPSDLVIVAIDEQSLSTLGRWPWNRRVHAELVQRLTDAGARAVVFDILFSEPDQLDPGADQALITAVRNNGRVILPVVIEQTRLGGQLLETLPIPALTEVAAALGHVNIELDPDGIARSVYLQEGLGEAYWPNLSVAALRTMEPGGWEHLPGARNREAGQRSRQVIVLDHRVLIPFTGPPGNFPRVPFSRVYRGDFPEDFFRDKIVLVGVTAIGLGDALPTPVSGLSQPMPGVEINANLLTALRDKQVIEPLSPAWRMPIYGLLLLTPILLFPLVTPRNALLITGVMLLGVIGFSALLLHAYHLWLAPTPVLLGLAASYPLWSWRRLEHTVRFFDQELERLHRLPRAVSFYGDRVQIAPGLDFLQQVIPFQGWVMRDASGACIELGGETPTGLGEKIPSDNWPGRGICNWNSLIQGDNQIDIGICWEEPAKVSPGARQLLDNLFHQLAEPARVPVSTTLELIENQIRQIQSAIEQLRTMHGFISGTLRQMVDGLIVANPFGQVVLANDHAARYLQKGGSGSLDNRCLLELVDEVQTQGPHSWREAFREVLLAHKTISFEGRLTNGRELFIQISPLSISDYGIRGMIITLSDITPLKESERKRAQALSFLSHDLRSPISSLISLAEMWRDQEDRFTREEMTDGVSKYAKKALTLSEDFLQLARAENLDQNKFHETDFVAVAYNALDELYTQASLKGIELARNIPVEEAWISADAQLLERALCNLLGNAIGHSPEGGTVELSVSCSDEQLTCSIQDQGPGIEREDQQRIFEPFIRGKREPQGSDSGAGLGLAFVKAVAEKHNGTVELTSEPGHGACFILHLPILTDLENEKE